MSKNAKYLIIDTESTGLHAAISSLIEVGIIITDQNLNILDQKVWEIQPEQDTFIDEEAMKVNNIVLNNRPNAISPTNFCHEFYGFLNLYFSEQPIVVAQFYPFDYSYLDTIFVKNGFDSRLVREILGNNFIDTKALAYYFNLKAAQAGKEIPFPITSLSKEGGLAHKLGISGFKAHTALGDCQATLEVLKMFLKGNY
jgi:DNA polymerase III epsilon subunit-like protein